MAEPPIELSDRSRFESSPRAMRPSVDSLQRDIAEAIQAAAMDDPPQRASTFAETLATMTSVNSLMTGNSYIDFDDQKSVGRSLRIKRRTKRLTSKAQQMRKAVVSSSVGAGTRALRPLKIFRRPIVFIQDWWRRRNQLPPSKDGRKIRIEPRILSKDTVEATIETQSVVLEEELEVDSVVSPRFADAEAAVTQTVPRRKRKLFNGPQKRSRKAPMRTSSMLVDERTGKPYCGNLITSSIYTVHDFVPRQLVAQFSKLANMYFLFVAILQMIPGWSTTGNYTTIVPLCIFVMISMGREGYEDWVRHRNDREENNRKVLVRSNSGWDTVLWKDVIVGDIVRILQNEWIPADLVLLHSSGVKGQCSIETLALDGETNLKSREVLPDVQQAFRVDNADETQALVTVEDPNLDLFNFEGTIELNGELIPVNNNNVIYRGCTLRNTASISGLVVYSGMETKMQLNASKGSRTKAPKLQGKVNRVVIVLACLVILLSGILTAVSKHRQKGSEYWYLKGLHVSTTENMMGFIIMLNTLIPISLYVSMEICKVFQTWLMNSDIDMYDEVNDVRAKVQSSSLNEELGQVSYVFSDKTGTLTDNIMLFRKLSVGGHAWIHDLDLYLGDDQDDGGYLFHQARPNTDMEVELLEQLSKLPRKSFGGRIGRGRPSVGRPSMSRPSMGRPSMGRPSMGRTSLGRHSTDQPSTGRPTTSQPPTSRPSGVSFRQSLGYAQQEDTGAAYTGRPSMASFARSIVTSHSAAIEGNTSAAAVNWQSSAAPNRTQDTPSTLTLLEYILASPNSAYTKRARFFLLALALCHTASPVVDLTDASGEVEIEQLDYQASSPDELALVAAARDLGYLVVDRQNNSITVRTYPHGLDHDPQDQVYKVLDVIEFSSSRKRMSVIVEIPDGQVVIFCKGADNIMLERLHKDLLSVAQHKQESIYEDQQFRRSVEAELANEQRSYAMGFRPSLDLILRRSNADTDIQESGRRSLQLQRQSVNLRRNIYARSDHNSMHSVRNNVQNAIIDATMAASENVAQTRASLDANHFRASMEPVHRRPNNEQIHKQFHSSESFHTPAQHSVSFVHEDSRTTPEPHLTNHTAYHTLHHNTPGSHSVSFARNEDSPVHQSPEEELDERQILEKTLEHIDEFSTDGLRTLLYGHRFISRSEYEAWKADYDNARAAISNRQAKMQEVGERIEKEFEITGASAIEDKLQRGVPEAIDKLRRANIRMWMLTGDKRETAVNIGYSCRLIKDFSTVIPLRVEDNLEDKIIAALEELENNSIAHCVVVIDGQTLAVAEQNPVLLSLFTDLGLRADSVIVCRASPAQKANIVECVRKREPSKVMLAIGDGANDIAMIQAADVGVGIAGREGLQASRSSDFSIGQFRFLLKLLLVHGRWNYIRTCKYVLATFYKEFFFYISQVVYQRFTMFTGTSVFESWSISMFNTLFTSLPVISLGVMDQDLIPTTLIAVPELYNIGQKDRHFHMRALLFWQVVASLECVMVGFLTYELYGRSAQVKDNTIFPFGVIIYTSVVFIVNFKTQFITMMYYITMFSILCVIISCCGYWLFNILIGLVYIVDPSKTYFAEREFWTQSGDDLMYWATWFLCVVIGLMFELCLKMGAFIGWPTDVDEFQALEKDPYIMRRLESEAALELSQGWAYQDKMPHKWSDILRGKLPGQPRSTMEIPSKTAKRRHLDILAEKLRFRKPVDYDKEIQEIIERRQRETEAG